MVFRFRYFTAKMFYFLRIHLWVCPRAFFTNLWVELSFIILEYPGLFLLLNYVSDSIKSPFYLPVF